MLLTIPEHDTSKNRWLLNSVGEFRLDELYWSNVTEFLQVGPYHRTEQFKPLRFALNFEERQVLLQNPQLIADPLWLELRESKLHAALIAKFEGSLEARASLLSTDDAELVVYDPDPYWNEVLPGKKSNRLGKLLKDVRTLVALRANDVQSIQCCHQAEPLDECSQVCIHVLDQTCAERFLEVANGSDTKSDRLWCEACNEDTQAHASELRLICESCFEYHRNKKPKLSGFVRQQAPKFAKTDLHFESSPSWSPFENRPVVLALQPDETQLEPCYVVLSADGRVSRVWPQAKRIESICTVNLADLGSQRDSDGEEVRLSMRVSNECDFLAVFQTTGQFGKVFRLSDGHETMQLDRGDYHVGHCRYSIAFIHHHNRTLLVHATDWNRLDVSDPQNGELLTDRGPTSYQKQGVRPDHYLDYFHCDLQVSPDGKWISDNGWVWHPLGYVRVWSIDRWLEQNVWESEDGPSVRDGEGRVYFWDGPLCWLDHRTIAVWGYGNDEESMLDAAVIWDVESGDRSKWIAGPKGEFFFDQHLVSSDLNQGTTVWSVESGDCILKDHNVVLSYHHRRSRTFLSVDETNSEWTVRKLANENR
jgi:predicted NAD-dependent protein-ADP-ribosyltransferase YbiA (DUF1768 family)